MNDDRDRPDDHRHTNHAPRNNGSGPPSHRPPITLAKQPGDEGMMLLSVAQTAKRLSLSERTINDLVKINAIPHKRIGRRVLFSVRELEAWIAIGTPDHPGAAEEARRLAWQWLYRPDS